LEGEAKIHLSYFYRGLARILKPGRVAMVHVAQIPRMKRTGGRGIFDFRGLNIRLSERAGLIFEYDWCVTKNPQALRNGTRVATPNGWSEIQSLRVGDYVIGSDGSPTEVLGVYPHEVRPMYRVTFQDGRYLDTDEKHLWTVRNRRGDSRDMTTGEMMAEGLKTPSNSYRFSIPMISNPVEYQWNFDLPIDPYTLGVLIGDGSIVDRDVGLCTDLEIIDSMPLPTGHSVVIRPNKFRANGTVATAGIKGGKWHDNQILCSLRLLGLQGKRSYEKFIPEQYMLASVDNRFSLLQGLLDTDGTVKKNGVVRYSTTSQKLCEDVRRLVESLGGYCTVKEYDEDFRDHKLFDMCVVIDTERCPFRLKRKAVRWKKKKRLNNRNVVSIQRVGESECTCIEVAANDKLYVAEGCIVTHNSQAIRTKSHNLQFAGLERDRANARGALPDYLLKFVADGENAVPINEEGEVSRNDWIQWAEGCWDWHTIRETDTLNVSEGRSENDTKHICPLQLPVIRRLIKLYSNKGELVFSPFTGIGSEGFEAIKLGRRFLGCEIKKEYIAAAKKNLERATNSSGSKSIDLFE